jgi:hypothetical protein
MMNCRALVVLALLSLSSTDAASSKSKTNPIEKVIEMVADLQQKIIAEGQAAQKTYDEFAEWCEDEAKNLQFEIKTAKAEAEDLSATIEKAASDISIEEEEIAKYSGQLASDNSDLKAATAIREKENKIFSELEKELVDTVDTLDRAIAILEREMQAGASLVQIKSAANIAQALKMLLTATGISSEDSSRLKALVQTQEGDEDETTGAPDPAAYESKSGGIIDVLNDMLEKAESQLDEARKVETKSQFQYDKMKLELEDAIKFGQKEMDKAKKKKAAAEETKATAEGELEVVNKGLAEDITQLNNIHHDCMTKAEDFEVSTKSRGEELAALAKAKKIIIEATGGASAQTYGLAQVEEAPEFVQLTMSTRSDEAKFRAVRYIHGLARKLHSAVLMQLADRMAAASTLASTAGEDPFAKIKGLIGDMIEKLMKEAEAEAAKKGYCDKEMSETETKKTDLETEIEKLSTKIEKMSAESKKLKEEVAILSKELADLAKSQAEMDKVRNEEHEEFVANKAEMEQGLEGIRLALKVLREYYAKSDKGHDAAEGSASGIIGLLEVAESDFSKGLSDMISEEETAAVEYEKTTKENEILKATKEQDVKYKTKEAKGLDTSVSEASEDKTGLQTELDAVLEYYDKIKEECIAKVDPYEERKKRREEEIAGLKEALSILEGEAVLLQEGSKRTKGVFRGGRIQA